MILNEGDIVEIRGRKATVCYVTKYNEKNYICVSFEEKENVSFELFEYIFENGKLLVTDDLTDIETMAILKVFIQEGMNEYGLPEKLQNIYNKIADKSDK